LTRGRQFVSFAKKRDGSDHCQLYRRADEVEPAADETFTAPFGHFWSLEIALHSGRSADVAKPVRKLKSQKVNNDGVLGPP